MALKGTYLLQGTAAVPDCYLTVVGITGGHRSGVWTAEIEVYLKSPESVVEQVTPSFLGLPDRDEDGNVMPMVSVTKVIRGEPIERYPVSVPYSAGVHPYALVYAALMERNPDMVAV